MQTSLTDTVNQGNRKYVKIEWTKEEDDLMENMIVNKFSKKITEYFLSQEGSQNRKIMLEEMNTSTCTSQISFLDSIRRYVVGLDLVKLYMDCGIKFPQYNQGQIQVKLRNLLRGENKEESESKERREEIEYGVRKMRKINDMSYLCMSLSKV